MVSDRSVRCWKENFSGPGQPEEVIDVRNATAVTSGENFNCALIAGGSVQCWGDNKVEQLGIGPSASTAPVTVMGVTGAKSISSGHAHTCAVVAGGRVQCWGDNGQGQLGVGTVGGTMKAVTVVAQ